MFKILQWPEAIENFFEKARDYLPYKYLVGTMPGMSRFAIDHQHQELERKRHLAFFKNLDKVLISTYDFK
jgi:hypothetical protein